MLVNTATLGAVEVPDGDIFNFPDGLLGFEQIKDWALIDRPGEPFKWLQALHHPELAFILMHPGEIRKDWGMRITESDLTALGVPSVAELTVWVILTIPDDAQEMTANFQGPVVVNRVTRVGRQCIVLNPDYTVRHKVLDEMARSWGQGAA